MVEMVVRAQFGFSMPKGRYPWQVTKGDTGIVRWSRHPRYARFVELFVVWDNDPARKARRTVFSSLELIGIQIDRHRIMVLSAKPFHS